MLIIILLKMILPTIILSLSFQPLIQYLQNLLMKLLVKRAFVISEVREMLTTIKTLTYDFDDASEEISDLHKKPSNNLGTLIRARKKEKGLPVRAQKTNTTYQYYIPNNLTKVVEIPSLKKKISPIWKKKDLLLSLCSIKVDYAVHEAPIQEFVITDDILAGRSFFTALIDSTIIEKFLTDGDNQKVTSSPILKAKDLEDLSNIENVLSGDDNMKVTSSHKLETKDIEDILNDRMLSDSVIQYFQNLIIKVYPSANGLEDPILRQK
ncbi:uncharacterized protein LOC136084760 [Hydra vulgaris]|uniref:Uncharacterized protein LOC136084760 n=1 Tax=Hydra vulgaris TaxID=6087 RepID=A0ABM4CIW9_HYDVU